MTRTAAILQVLTGQIRHHPDMANAIVVLVWTPTRRAVIVQETAKRMGECQ